MGEDQLPTAVPRDDGLQLVLRVIKSVIGMGVGCGFGAGKQGHDVFPIDGMIGQFGPDVLGQGGQDVDGHEHCIAGGACWDLLRPAHDAGDAFAAFPGGSFALAQGTGGAAVIAIAEPRAVVGGENDQGVVGETVLG